MNHSRFASYAWKLFVGLECILLALTPLHDVFRVYSVQAAYVGGAGASGAQSAVSGDVAATNNAKLKSSSGGVASTPTPIPCGAGVWCTDIQQAREIDKVKSNLDYQLLMPVYLGVINAMNMVTQQLAYDTAVWVSNGGKGSMPLYEVLSWNDYSKQILMDAAGEFIGTISDKFTEGAFGVNLCRPPRFQALNLEFALGLPTFKLTGIARPKPECSWTSIVSNWEATKDSLTESEVIDNISGTFTTGGNDVSYALGLNLGYMDYTKEKEDAGLLDRLEGKGFKSVTSFISGNIKTPADVVERSVVEQLVQAPIDAQNVQAFALLNNAFALGAVQVGTIMISTFTNVLVSRLLGKLTKGLFDPSGQGLTIPDFSNLNASPLSASGGKAEEIISDQFSDILTPKIASMEAQDIVGELLGCPDTGRTKWNCAIDASFSEAIRQGGMTLRQAIDGGYINGSFQLIPSTQLKDNLDTGCKDRAFCVANLRKLRLARIIPIGWEMAADSAKNQSRCAGGSCVTLQEAIDGFHDCNTAGALDWDHPWCHLIDQNWVLTSFQAQCLTKGYGNSFISGTNERMQECQDTVTCLEKDANGKCSKGYGYCMAEQTFYQFDSLTCKEEYVSCRSFTPRGSNAKSIGYLRSTLDYGACNESNIGCMWYSTKRVKSATWSSSGSFSSLGSGSTGALAWSNADEDRIYFDKSVETCSASGDGCTDLRKVEKYTPSLNLIRNSSFETVDEKTKALTYWVNGLDAYTFDETPMVYQEASVETGSNQFNGSKAQLINRSIQQTVELQPGRQYTLSFYARSFANVPESAGAVVTFYRADVTGDERIPSIDPSVLIKDTTFYRSSTCAPTGALDGGLAYQALVSIPKDFSSDWKRSQCSFVAPAGTKWATIRLISDSTSWLVDAVQLEESETATAYQDGLNQMLSQTFLKTPPKELGCIGEASTDDPLCSNYARVCRASEAGCQGYTQKDQSASPEVPAVLSSVDYCPAECVGYAQFRKEASTFDLVHNAFVAQYDDPEDISIASFIPSTAKTCSAQNVGCEVFTVIDDSSSGGENAKAFSYLRLCEDPNDETQTYYTWEGSEASGYQLVTWSLQKDMDAPVPQPPIVIVRAGKDGLIKDPNACNEESYFRGEDPDCRQFYDPQGFAFYVYESQTVVADESCAQLRKSGSTKADCTKTGGYYDTETQLCMYKALPKDSTSCSVDYAGCRAYLGTQGGAQNTVMEEMFNEDTYSVKARTGVKGLSLSEESVLVGDKSLRIALTNASTAGQVTFDVQTDPGMLYELSFWAKGTRAEPYKVNVKVSDPSKDSVVQTSIGTALVDQQWNVYRIGPFSGSSSLLSTSTRIHLSGFIGSIAFLDTIHVTQVTDVAFVVKDSWVTPVTCDQTALGVAQPQAMLGCQDYVDRKQKTVHVRQFTNLCRETSIGCSAFIDTKNSQSSYEERWTKATNEDPSSDIQLTSGTCKTNNFSYPTVAIQTEVEGEMTVKSCTTDVECKVNAGNVLYKGRCSARLTVHPADQFEYYIDDDASSCKESQVGCRAFGLPKYDQTRLSLNASADEKFETVYLKDDVTKYTEALCSEDELFCESYTYNASGQSGTEYFKAPSDHACEYKEGVVVARSTTDGASAVAENCTLPNPENYVDATYDGWFRVGTDCPCYPDRLSLGKNFGLRMTGDIGYNAMAMDPAEDGSTYQGWAGICPETQAECTEFRDVNDQSDPMHPLGRPYFVINDERLDKESCDGKTDPGNGCVLFRDLSDPALTANSLATFKEYVIQGNHAVSPVDCTLTPDLQACVDAKVEALHALVKKAMIYYRTEETKKLIEDRCGFSREEDHWWDAGLNASTDGIVMHCLASTYDGLADSYLAEYNELVSGLLPNDTNTIIKVKADRSCSQWLACKTGETVYDQSTGQYASICSQLELCNKAGVDQGEGIPFCENYVDRSAMTLDTIIKKYRVLSERSYAVRPVGFGKVDYSGSAIPDEFQVMDTALSPIGSELITDQKTASQYKKDYRLVVRVPVSSGYVRAPTALEAEALAGMTMRNFACYYPQTNAYGLFTDAEGITDPNKNRLLEENEKIHCALSLDQSQPSQGVEGASLVAENLNTLSVIQRFAQTDTPSLDQIVSRSFPNTQCKAAPQADAPFGNEFIQEWDSTVNPPLPKRASTGYGNANFCEYGEDCACTYKKVTYGKAMSKFYEPLSTDVVNAVCVGGTRDSLPCVPDSGVEGSQDVSVTVSSETDAETEATSQTTSINTASALNTSDEERCGEGGVCTPIANVTLVRGVSGQCLQYDISRPIAGDQTRSECLVWNPTPVLTGPNDPYHWDPTSGYQPPQSSGRYYCTAPVREPREEQFHASAVWPKSVPKEGFSWSALTLSVFNPLSIPGGFAYYGAEALLSSEPDVVSDCGDGDSFRCTRTFGPWPNSEGSYAGRITNFFYADWFTSDGSCSNFGPWNGCTGNEGGASLDGHKAKGTTWGGECEDVDDEGQAFVKNENIMRLVTTGQGRGRSYTEYAVLFNPAQTAQAALGFSSNDAETIFNYSLEDVIANFEFTVPKRKLACAYTAPWADVSVGDYDDETKWKRGDDAWHSAFISNLTKDSDGTLNRSTAKILTEDGTPSGIPVKVDCAIGGSTESGAGLDRRGGDAGLCYLKTWELNYRADGQQKFQAFSEDMGRTSLDHLSRRPIYGKCESANPWFSIRAVFEDTNPSENTKDPLEVNADQLVGPFQFVGLWVTACAPGDQTQYIYMDMKMHSADVCRELAETISKDSHDSAVFTDRIWESSGYSLKNGFGWDAKNSPFGASLATGDAETQPLFMTGVKQKDVNPMNPPTFTSSGQTYFSSTKYPTSNWGLLSNVFAKIYRIYSYSSRAVTRDDYACTNKLSPEFSQWCPPVMEMPTKSDLIAQLARERDVVASTIVLTSAELATTKEGASSASCGFYGTCMKGGIDSTQLFSQKVCNSFSGVNRGLDCSSDPDICHTSAMKMTASGDLEPSYASCSLFTGYDPKGAVDSNGEVKQAIDQTWIELDTGRFRCEGDDCVEEGCKWDPEAKVGKFENGCSRKQAIQEGAFRCSGGSVRDPNKVRETIDQLVKDDHGGDSQHVLTDRPTYASFCTKESERSTECPMEVISKCINKKTVGELQIGICEGYTWAECEDNGDCQFQARHYWPSGSVNQTFYWARSVLMAMGLGQHDEENIEQEEELGTHFAEGEKAFYTFDVGGDVNDDNDTWFTKYDEEGTIQVNASAYREAFWPALPVGLCEDCGGSDNAIKWNDEGAWFYPTLIHVYPNAEASGGGADVFVQYVPYDSWNDTSSLDLYPGFNPHIWSEESNDEEHFNGKGIVSQNVNQREDVTASYRGTQALDFARVYSDQALAEAQAYKDWYGNRPEEYLDCDDDYADDVETILRYGEDACSCNENLCPSIRNSLTDVAPYMTVNFNDLYGSQKKYMVANYGACESVPLMFRAGKSDGEATKVSDNASVTGICRGGGVDGKTCSIDTDCAKDIDTLSNGMTLAQAQTASEDWCQMVTSGEPNHYSGIPAKAFDCWPAGSDTVANSPAFETDPSKDSNICTHPAGYWPRPQYCLDPDDEYCGLFGYDLTQVSASVSDRAVLPTDVSRGLYTPLYLRTSGSGLSTVNDYNYVDYYNPIPPHTAAPDTRTCQGQQCRITEMDTFSVDGFAEGVVNGGVGSHVATIRFYAWASHNQMPIRKVYVDWGDGTTSELPDAYLKNRKPYCGVQKECSETTGLTCQTDADCPVGGGQCVMTGSCSTDPTKNCTKDVQCTKGGEEGICEARTYFGNDDDACQETYFEFRHAYSCDADITLSSCYESLGRCKSKPWGASTDWCTAYGDTTCGAGDTCVTGASTDQSGCFSAKKKACIYTPRIKVIDNWGWCTGECRSAFNESKNLIDSTSSNRTKRITHPNGGCYDASNVKSNVDFMTPLTAVPGTTEFENECGETGSISKHQRPWISFPGSVQVLPGEEL